MASQIEQLLTDLAKEGLSPPAAAAVSTLSSAASRAGGSLGASDYQRAIGAAVNAVPAVALMAGAGPIAGTVLAAAVSLFNAAGWASGIGPCASNRSERAQWCQASYITPVPTGPDGRLVFSDWFAPGHSALQQGADPAPGGTPTFGRSLQLIALTKSDDLVSSYKGLPAMHRSAIDGRLSKILGRPARPNLGGAVGINKNRVDLNRRLLDQIQMQHKKIGTDGGDLLGLVFRDVITNDFNGGRITPELAAMILDNEENRVSMICTDVADPGENCLEHDLRRVREVLEFVRGWDQTVRPMYSASPAVQGGLLGTAAPTRRPSFLRFVLGTAAVGALGLGIARPALALSAARRAAVLARRAGGAVRAVVTR